MSQVIDSALVIGRALDLDLIHQAQGGDEAAFTELLRPLVAPAYRLAGAMLHDPQASEDVVQEASLKAWRKVRQVRPGASMKPWFLGIVANECREVRRGRWWSVLKQATPELPPSLGPESSSALHSDLRRAIRRLKHRRRLLLVLHWYLDLPVGEIALIARTSEDAVKSELSRAIGQLRNMLGEGER
jgi:RNA polymerase sigma-70 factor, ECF subfamily